MTVANINWGESNQEIISDVVEAVDGRELRVWHSPGMPVLGVDPSAHYYLRWAQSVENGPVDLVSDSSSDKETMMALYLLWVGGYIA